MFRSLVLFMNILNFEFRWWLLCLLLMFIIELLLVSIQGSEK